MKYIKQFLDIFYFDKYEAIDRFVITEYKPIDRTWAKLQLLRKLED